MSLFKHIARELVTDELTAAEVAQIRQWLPLGAAPTLDLGCGWGRHARLLASARTPVVGVDRYVGFRGEVEHHSGVRFEHLHFHQLGDFLAHESVGAAYSWQNSMFCQSPLDTLESLRGVAAVMKPGGRLLLQNTSRAAAAKPEDVTFKGVRQVTTWDETKGRVDVRFSRGSEADATAIYCYTRESLALLLDLAGFDLVRWADDGSNVLSLSVRRDDSGRLGFDEAEDVARIADDLMKSPANRAETGRGHG